MIYEHNKNTNRRCIYLKEPNKNSGTEKYNTIIEKFTRCIQQKKESGNNNTNMKLSSLRSRKKKGKEMRREPKRLLGTA